MIMSNKKWNKSLNALLASSLVASIAIPVVPAATVSAAAQDLIISEYIEGSGSNKAIELYNGTGSTIDLSQYTLELYSNGSTTPVSVSLNGSLEHGNTFVIYNGSAGPEIKSKGNLLNNAVINFNGDDAVVLRKAGAVVDSIGQVGARVENMKDVTLVRKSNILSGDTIINDAFDPALEWISYPTDTFEKLGTHVMLSLIHI